MFLRINEETILNVDFKENNFIKTTYEIVEENIHMHITYVYNNIENHILSLRFLKNKELFSNTYNMFEFLQKNLIKTLFDNLKNPSFSLIDSLDFLIENNCPNEDRKFIEESYQAYTKYIFDNKINELFPITEGDKQ